MTIKVLRDFIFENYYKQIGFSKGNSYYSMKIRKKDLQLFRTKLTEEIPDFSNAKEYHNRYLRRKTQNQ